MPAIRGVLQMRPTRPKEAFRGTAGAWRRPLRANCPPRWVGLGAMCGGAWVAVFWGSEPQRRHNTRRERTKKRRKATQPKTCTVPCLPLRLSELKDFARALRAGSHVSQSLATLPRPQIASLTRPSVQGKPEAANIAIPDAPRFSARMRDDVSFLLPAESCCLVTNSLLISH